MASLQRLLFCFPLRGDGYRRKANVPLKDGITRRELKAMLRESPVKIFNRQCVLLFGCFPSEMVENAVNEMNATVLNPRGFLDFIPSLKEYLFNERQIVYFSGAMNFISKPDYFKDAVNEIGNKLAAIDNTAIVAKDMNDVRRLAFEWFIDTKHENGYKRSNGLIALNPSIPAAVIPDLCDVCIVFIEKQKDCEEMNEFIRRRKIVIPILINNIQSQSLNSLFEAIEYAFDVKRRQLCLRENNYERIAEILDSILKAGMQDYFASALEGVSQ